VRPSAVAAALITVLLVATVPPGCLNEGGDGTVDLSTWEAGMSIEKFETNGARAVNTTHLRFEVDWGGQRYIDWLVGESHGFTKGKVDYFTFTVTATYMNGTVREPFPVQGPSNRATGAVQVRSKDLLVILDGDASTYVVGREYDIQPHDWEASVRIHGDYGDLVIYFLLREPGD
jgi:hypothetical protein